MSGEEAYPLLFADAPVLARRRNLSFNSYLSKASELLQKLIWLWLLKLANWRERFTGKVSVSNGVRSMILNNS
jgi:hypothetical protein